MYVKKEIIERVLDKLYEVTDRGPPGEGWKSDELINLIHELEDLIGMPMEEMY